MIQTEFIKFQIINTPCCHAMLCWVNPRLPNYCPECGERIFTKIRNSEYVRLVDDNARLIHKEIT